MSRSNFFRYILRTSFWAIRAPASLEATPRQQRTFTAVLLLQEHTGSCGEAERRELLKCKLPEREQTRPSRPSKRSDSVACSGLFFMSQDHCVVPRTACFSSSPPTLEPITESPPPSPPIPRAIAFAASAPLARVKAAWRARSFATVDVVQISGAQKHQVPSGCVSWCLPCHVTPCQSCHVISCRVQFSPPKRVGAE